MRSSVPSQFQSRNNQTACSSAAGLWEHNATASRAQHIHEAVHDFRGSTERLRPPRLPEGSRLDVRPLIVRQIAGITQLVTIVFRRFSDVHIGGPSSNQATSLESQMIHPTQLLPGRTPRHPTSGPGMHRRTLNTRNKPVFARSPVMKTKSGMYPFSAFPLIWSQISRNNFR